ncbi:restriction endonuclease [Halomontanus rarus]|uniref:restriction endonuclease n=1 Tax=Halomontanus rarus TaxID=3034020 RepID=UPI00307C0509
MDDYEFEHFVSDLWEEMGWSCKVSTASNDKGIDVRAKKANPYEQKALIQAKRYAEGNKVGSPAIQQYSSLKHQENKVDKVIVVTTSSYSRNAVELADDLNVKLIDGDDLVDLIDQEGADELVAEYIDTESDESEEAIPEDHDVERDENWREPSTSVSDSGTEAVHSHVNHGEVQLPDTVWKKRAAISTVGLWIVSLLIDTLPDSIMSPLLLVFWIGIPICLYKDSQATLEVVQWPQRRKLYIGAAAFPGLGIIVGPWYLLVRYAVQRGYLSVKRNTPGNVGDAAKDSVTKTSASTSLSDPVDEFDINHYTDATDHIKQLKREGKHDTAEVLLHWCIDQAEVEAKENGYSEPPRWYYKHLAIIYRKDGRYDDEQAILERYIEVCNELGGQPHEEIVDRLDRT